MPITAENRFYLRPFGQEEGRQDYHRLPALSNFQVPQELDGNQEWQHNRCTYDETSGRLPIMTSRSCDGEKIGTVS